MDDIVKRIRQQSYFGPEPYEAANEIEQLRQRVQELETQLAKNNPLLDEAADAIDKLTAERDELLAAIKRAKYWMAGSEAKRILDEAIASVKEKQNAAD